MKKRFLACIFCLLIMVSAAVAIDVDAGVVNGALDNIADWNGDNRTRAETIKEYSTDLAVQELCDAIIYDADRIHNSEDGGQVGIIRAQVTPEPPHDGE